MDRRIKKWQDTYGGNELNNILSAKAMSSIGDGKKTGIELILDSRFSQSGRAGSSQVDLGFARIDNLVETSDGSGWIAVSADGSHWHKDDGGHDLGKSNQMIGYEVDGKQIVASVRISESDIVDDPFVIELALEGVQQNEFV